MKARTNSTALSGVWSHSGLTRRQLVTGAAIAMGGIAANAALLGEPPQQPLPEKPGTTATSNRTSLHDEVMVKTSPQRIYELLLDSKQFAALTGAPAEIDPKAGRRFLAVWRTDRRTKYRARSQSANRPGMAPILLGSRNLFPRKVRIETPQLRDHDCSRSLKFSRRRLQTSRMGMERTLLGANEEEVLLVGTACAPILIELPRTFLGRRVRYVVAATSFAPDFRVPPH